MITAKGLLTLSADSIRKSIKPVHIWFIDHKSKKKNLPTKTLVYRMPVASIKL
jgi:hypothetical protein